MNPNPKPLSTQNQKSGNPKWEDDVRDMFSKLRGSSDITEVEIDDIKLKVFPGVFSPKIFFESQWFAEKVAKIAQSKKLLEIGPGTGIIGLFSALKNASVTVVDINEAAIENTKVNFAEHNLTIDARLGSVYEPLDALERYDIIFWNHPFNKTNRTDNDPFLKSVFDYEYKYLETYISEAAKHLSAQGRLLLGTSNIADLDAIEEISRKYDYDFVLVEKIDRETEVDGTKIDFRIYEFIPGGAVEI